MNPLTQQLMSTARPPLEFVGFTASGMDSGSSDTATVSTPTSFKAGDLLVAVGAGAAASTLNLALPSGWTNAFNGTAQNRCLGWLVFDGTPASYAFVSPVTGTTMSVIVTCFRNAAFDVAGTISSLSPSPSAPSITISENNSILLVCGSSASSFTASGFTQIEDMIESGANYTSETGLALFYKTINAGPTGTTQVNGSDGFNRAFQFSLRQL